jgi:hypothetical protein
MIDFPRSLPEFQRRFGDEATCAEYLAAVRWADGFRCPACGGDKGWRPSTKPFPWECADCGKLCKAHDFVKFTGRPLNFFQHHNFVTAKVPRTDCPEHGVLRITGPRAPEGSRFTLLFEQAARVLAETSKNTLSSRRHQWDSKSACHHHKASLSATRFPPPRLPCEACR